MTTAAIAPIPISRWVRDNLTTYQRELYLNGKLVGWCAFQHLGKPGIERHGHVFTIPAKCFPDEPPPMGFYECLKCGHKQLSPEGNANISTPFCLGCHSHNAEFEFRDFQP